VFIKEITKKNKKDGKTFISHRLVESYRTPDGPRHRVILQLGTVDLPKKDFKALADRIEALVNGTEDMFPVVVSKKVEALARHYANMLISKEVSTKGEEISGPDKKEKERDYHVVDVNSIETSTVRQIGAEIVSLHGFEQLGFRKILKEAGFSKKEIDLATLAIVGRLVHPGSDLGTVRWAREISGIDELIGTNFKTLGKNALYKIGEKLYEKKEYIDLRLQEREGALFNLDRKIILYDLTNTYMEGTGWKSDLAKYGHSKEKRMDCPLVTLGFVIDGQGFPLASKVLRGNQMGPETLKDMLEELQKSLPDTGKAPIVIMDAGIGTQGNLDMIREKGYDYLVVSRKHYDKEIDPDAMIEITDGKDRVIKAQLIKKDGEQILYCESAMRRKKEEAIKTRLQQRFESGLEKIRASLTKPRGTKNYDKVLIRLGKLQEKNNRVAHFYHIEVIRDPKNNRAVDLKWTVDTGLMEERFGGRYYLRTSRMDLGPSDIKSLYTTLTNVEDSFRSMKSDLGMRPIYHQKDLGIRSHLYITVLAYHVLQYLRHQLRGQGIHIRWAGLRERLMTHVRVTTSFTNDEGRRVFIRNSSQPNLFNTRIYQALNCPARPLKNFKYIK
jgi:transposase